MSEDQSQMIEVTSMTEEQLNLLEQEDSDISDEDYETLKNMGVVSELPTLCTDPITEE